MSALPRPPIAPEPRRRQMYQPTAGEWYTHPNGDFADSINHPLILSSSNKTHIAVISAGMPDDEMEANGRVLSLASRMLRLLERIATDSDSTEVRQHRQEAQNIVLQMWSRPTPPVIDTQSTVDIADVFPELED